MTDKERQRQEAEERFAAGHPEGHMRRREFLTKTAMLAGAAGLASAIPARALISEAAKVQTRAALPSPSNMPVDTFVVLMQENRSFDHYLGWHPEADAMNSGLSYPDTLNVQHPTHPLNTDYQGCLFNDPDHSWTGGRRQFNNGALDGFRKAPNDEFAIGYYDEGQAEMTTWLSKNYTLFDRYFCSLLGPTWPNREYMHSATSYGIKSNGAIQDVLGQAAQGGLYRWLTIWDLMLSQGLSCTYYYSDLPFIGIFGSRYLPIIKPISEFYADAAAGNLPNLAFVDPMFVDGGGFNGLSGDEHPHGDIRIGQAFQSNVVRSFVTSAQFRTGALFVNYDEWGGFFDHVSPVLVPDDRQNNADLDNNFAWSGFRIPGTVVSPWTRASGPNGRVSHQTVTHESILKMISYRFGLGYLNKRHRYASNIGRSFDWDNPNFSVPNVPLIPPPVTLPCAAPSEAGAPSGLDAAAERSEKEEGLHIGSPAMLTYLDELGYPTAPADPRDVFNSSAPPVQRLGRQMQAQGRGEEGE